MEHTFNQSVRTGLTILLSLYFMAVHGFIYDEIMKWPETNYFCGSCLQSPINLMPDSAQKLSLQQLIIRNHDRPTNFSFLVNDGDGVTLKIDSLVNATITGGNNDELFEFDRINFHWGEGDNKGTEHAINFVQYALELQIVNRNVAFFSSADAYRGVNGFLILSILFRQVRADKTVPPGMKTVCSNLHSIRYHDHLTTALPRQFRLDSLYAGLRLNEYITYCGSHTVPPCTPNAIWIVFPQPLDIDSKCLHNFRSVIANNGMNMTSTVRPLQAAGPRMVYYNVS